MVLHTIRDLRRKFREHLTWRYLQLRYSMSPEIITRSISGSVVELDAGSFREFLRIMDFQNEEYVIEELLSRVQPGDVFWDVGANIGTHSCYIGKAATFVVALEPHPGNAERARANMRLNDVNGEVLEYALGESPTEAFLRLPRTDDNDIGVGTFTLQSGDGLDDVIDVMVTSGDSLLDEGKLPLPDVVKIDVEGAEVDVLQGFSRGLANTHTILIEVHTEYVNIVLVDEILEDGGFNVEVLGHRNDEIHLLGTRF